MPKAATYSFFWSSDDQRYTLLDRATNEIRPIKIESDWFDWLETHTSFSFDGRSGRLNLLKEQRKNSTVSYWYAYRRRGQRTFKRYAGRSSELSFHQLEQIAALLNASETSMLPKAVQAKLEGVPQEQLNDVLTNPFAATMSQHSLLLTPKLQPPRLHKDLIRREHLLTKLDAGLPRKLTLVSAPAGFGKTTLVRQWIAERSTQRHFPKVAWVVLDINDNDPMRFWRYVITACQSFGVEATSGAAALLQMSPQLPFKQSPLEIAVTALLNDVAQANEGILVLEDYHVISSPQIHETLTFLLDHLPTNLHLVIISRYHPSLPLARLSAAGDVCRIDPNELLFSSEESQRFLQHVLQLPMTSDLIDLLETRVEGWPVGLRLLALALEGQTDRQQIEASLRAFQGSHYSLQDYFVSEVLNDQSSSVQRFLLETSVLARFNASLCDAVTGRTTSADLLSQMDRGNVLLEPLDETNAWYRYHAMLASAMQEEARRRFGDAVLRELARRAGRWYEQHMMLSEAVEAAFQADDAEWAAALIERIIGRRSLINGLHLLQLGYHTLKRWLDRLPKEAFATRPRLLLMYAVALLFSCLLDMSLPNEAIASQIDRLLLQAEIAFSADNDQTSLGEVFALRSKILRQYGELAQAAQWGQKALQLLPDDDLDGRSISLNAIGFLHASNGQLYRAEEAIRAARALCEEIGNPMFVRANNAMLGWIFLEQGKLYAAEALFARVLAEARDQGDIDDIARLSHALADVAYEWNDLAIAQQRIEESVQLSQHFKHVYEVHLGGVLLQARIDWKRGQPEAARERFGTLHKRAEAYQNPAQKATYGDICIWQAWFLLDSGDLTAARRVFALIQPRSELSLFQQARVDQMEARFLLAEDKAADALSLLQSTLRTIENGENSRALLQTRALVALVYVALQRPEEAQKTIYDVLAQAQSEGYMRLFLDEGKAMAGLLRSTLPTIHEKHLASYIHQILRAFVAEHPVDSLNTSAFADALSLQEGRVLNLLAQGYSNPDIARELIISVNTVKAHIKNIYRKLGVSNRVEAGALLRSSGERY